MNINVHSAVIVTIMAWPTLHSAAVAPPDAWRPLAILASFRSKLLMSCMGQRV